MEIVSTEISVSDGGQGRALTLAVGTGWRRWLALTAIVLLAGALRFVNLQALGYANHYYTAGIVSMLQSWRNFYFAAAEPGGAVSIDKPPVGRTQASADRLKTPSRMTVCLVPSEKMKSNRLQTMGLPLA